MRSNNPRDYWKLLKSSNGTGKNKNDNISIDTLFNYFKTLNTAVDENSFEYNDIDMGPVNEILNSNITREEVEHAINTLKNNKACSDDCISNEYIKYSSYKMIDLYVMLFNVIFSTGKLPESWLRGSIVPIYKNKGSPSDPKNYRPITIVSCLGKLFTSILNERLQKYSNEFDLICENQAGFRKTYSTVDNIFVLYCLISLTNIMKKKLYCIFIDFEKAFDKVWRNGLWNKMLLNQINGKMYSIIYNMYQGIKSNILFNGQNSAFFACDIGLRQGENLSPFLFSLYLNDLEEFMVSNNIIGLQCLSNQLENDFHMYIKFFILLYADDTILFSDSPEDLQMQLNVFSEYCKIWRLKVNIGKTKCMIFSKGRLNNRVHFKFDTEEIEIVKSFTYLGTVFSRTGSFNEAKTYNVKKATIAMYDVLKKGKLYNLSVQCMYDLYDKIVKPILLYGCEIWGFTNLQVIERAHLKFCKLLLGVKRSTPTCMVYGELGACPLNISVNTRMLTYWSHMIKSKESKLNVIMYKLLCHNQYRSNNTILYLSYIKQLLDKCGISYVWNVQNIEDLNTTWLKSYVKQTLYDQFTQEWENDVFTSSKSSCYRIYKENFGFEGYLDVLTDKERNIFCKFRTTNHRFIIETGRWNDIERQDRICTHCNSQRIGDEFHYLLECQSLAEHRKKYLNKYFYERPNALKFREIMNSNHVKTLKKLCEFIKIIFNNICPP